MVEAKRKRYIAALLREKQVNADDAERGALIDVELKALGYEGVTDSGAKAEKRPRRSVSRAEEPEGK